MELTLVHRLKNGSHEIPLNAELAITPEAFATYTKSKGGEEIALCLGWTLVSTQGEVNGKKGKYTGHSFELRVPPEHLQALIDAAKVALKRFKEVQ
jgi:hypothetical protein